MYESREGHPIQFVNVVVLVRTMFGMLPSFYLQSRPALSPKNQQIREALNIVWIRLQYNGIRELLFNPLDQP